MFFLLLTKIVRYVANVFIEFTIYDGFQQRYLAPVVDYPFKTHCEDLQLALIGVDETHPCLLLNLC